MLELHWRGQSDYKANQAVKRDLNNQNEFLNNE